MVDQVINMYVYFGQKTTTNKLLVKKNSLAKNMHGYTLYTKKVKYARK